MENKMKTFDEAFEHILDLTKNSSDKIWQDMYMCKDYMSNESFKQLIFQTNIELIKIVVLEPDKERILAIMCAIMHRLFQVGILTGIEMEKSDDIFHVK